MGSKEEETAVDHTPFTLALVAGGFAGTTVDVALYPLDALKTRLQSPHGFWKAGGFSGIYRGVLATALGASPGSAMFFSACECRARSIALASLQGLAHTHHSAMSRARR